MTILADMKVTVKGSVKCPNCMAILLTNGPGVGLEFHRCLHIQGYFAIGGTYSQMVFYLDIGATLGVQATSLLMYHSLFYATENPQVMVLHDSTAGRCCLDRAMG